MEKIKDVTILSKYVLFPSQVKKNDDTTLINLIAYTRLFFSYSLKYIHTSKQYHCY